MKLFNSDFTIDREQAIAISSVSGFQTIFQKRLLQLIPTLLSIQLFEGPSNFLCITAHLLWTG